MSAKDSNARIDRAGIRAAYGLNRQTADAWVRLLNFPRPVDPERPEEWDAGQVDHWVRANRPQFWPARRPVTDTAETAQQQVAEDGPRDAASPGAGQEEPPLGRIALARRYRVSPTTLDRWRKATGAAAFPAESEPGKWRPDKVDTWVKKHRKHVWDELTGAGPKVVIEPPDGHPQDLYGIRGYGEILGKATRGQPLAQRTILSYKNRGLLPPPDRRPGDRKRPEVFEPMWYLATIREHVYSRRGPGRLRAGRARRSKKR